MDRAWSRLVQAVGEPDYEPGARWLLAYNLHQFAGLQVMLHVLASAGTLVAPGSRRPTDAIVLEGSLEYSPALPFYTGRRILLVNGAVGYFSFASRLPEAEGVFIRPAWARDAG